MMKKILLLCFILFSINTLAQTVKRSKVVSKGTITGMAYHPNVGMAITHGDGYVGFPALNGQVVDKQTGNPLSVDFPLLEKFQDAISDDNGGWYITQGNEFTKVDEYIFPTNKYTYILHLKADNSIDTTFRVQPNINFVNFNLIHNVKKYNNTIYAWCRVSLSNQFQLLGFDSTTGNLIWDSKTSTQGNTNTLNWQISQNRLFISGVFNKINDITNATKKAICYDLTNNTLTNWNPTYILALDGDNIADMTLSGNKVVFSAEYTYRIIAVDSISGTNKLWDAIYPDVNPTKIAATANDIFVLSQNRDSETQLNFSKIVKISAADGTLDNTWTINTNLGTRMYGLFVDTDFLYATCDIDVTVLNTKVSALIKINTINRSIEEWRPFNDPITNGASKPASIGVISESLKLAFDNSKVFIGGIYGLLKQNGKSGIALIRPESESVIDWKPNVKQFFGSSPSFENDSTLWVWGTIVTNDNQNLFNHFAAFDIRTGDLLRYFPSQILSSEKINKMVVAEGKIITTHEYSSNASGNRGYINSFNSLTGVKENWITAGIVNNFFVIDSLLYGNVGMAINGNYKSGFFSVNLKNNQFTDWIPQYPPNYSGNYEDFVIVGNSVVIMTNNKYYEFNRFTGKMTNSFGNNEDNGTFITAGEKYFFITRNGYDYYQTNRCGNKTSAFYYDLEYKKFSDSCFFKKDFPQNQGNYQLPSAYIDRQFFLAQNYLYFNLSWSGNNRPVGVEQSNFWRTSFPKGFFKDEINPAFFPKIGGNNGDVTLNFYGYSIVDGTTLKLKKSGEPDIVVPDSVLSFPQAFRMEAVIDLRGKASGDWDIELLFPNGEKLLFTKGFRVMPFTGSDIVINVNIPPTARLGAKRTIFMEVSNRGYIDVHGSTIWIAVSKNVKFNLKVPFTSDTSLVQSDSLYFITIDSLAGRPYNKNLYWLFIPNIKSRSVLEIPCSIIPLTNDTLKVDAWIGNPFYGSPITEAGLECITSIARTTVDHLKELSGYSNVIKECVTALTLDVLSGSILKATDPRTGKYEKIVDLISVPINYMIGCIGSVIDIVNPVKKASLAFKITYGLFVRVIEGYNLIEGGKEAYYDCKPLIPLLKNKVESFARVVNSLDPNDKLGPVGVKSQRYVNGANPFSYKIRFENFATATASAQYVRLVDTLDRTKFNFDTFQFGHFNVADTNFYASPGKKRHLVDWDLRPAKDLILRMEAKFIDSTGILEATYTALDPATMEWTEDPILGFLPPNVNAPEGEGSITFSIFPKDSLATGATISNKAYIYFDYNPVIPTPPWTNTIDATLPTSTMTNLAAVSRDTTIVLSWQGSDAESGAKLYDVMVSVNDGDYKPILLATRLTTFDFSGKADSTYKFYTVAYDSVYNKEPIPISFTAQTMVRFYPMIESVSSGNWDNPDTWDCNCVPTSLESVRIKGNHRILITPLMNNVKAKSVTLEAGAVLEQKGTLKLRTD